MAHYSDSQLDRETMGCFFALQELIYTQEKQSSHTWSDERMRGERVNFSHIP